ASWLLPLALTGLLAALLVRGPGPAAAGGPTAEQRPGPAARSEGDGGGPTASNNRPRPPLDRRGQRLPPWGVWLLTAAAFFSTAGFFHRYYLVMLSPPVAALAGIGAVALWQLYRGGGWRAWLLPAALLVTAAVQAVILRDYDTWSRRLTPP